LETAALLKEIRPYLKDLQGSYETKFESPDSALYDDGGIYGEIEGIKALIEKIDKHIKEETP